MVALTTNRENIMSLITAVKEGVRLRSTKARETWLREADAKLMQGLRVSTDRVIMVCMGYLSWFQSFIWFGERIKREILVINGQWTQ